MLKHILPELTGDTVADIFAGGCSVSLACKWRGQKVIASDIAYRSGVVAESLIANSVKLTDEDIYSLFLPNDKKGNFVEKNLGKYFPKHTAQFLDLALCNIREKPYPKNKMSELVIYNFIMSQRQFGQFGHNKDQEMIAEGKITELLESASESRAKKVEKMIAPILNELLKIKEQINQSVCISPHQNDFYQMDCMDFLKKMKREGKKIDCAYYDTPYGYVASAHYSKIYSVLDSVFAGKKDAGIKDEAFVGKDALKNFEKMFSLSEFIPKWVISMGCSNEKGIMGEELLAVVQKFRPAELRYLEHSWSVCNITKTVKTTSKEGGTRKEDKSGYRSQKDCIEYLIVTK